MRVAILISFLLPLLVVGQSPGSRGLVAKGLKKYAIEKGRITYTITGDASGEELFIFDRYGWRSLKKRTMDFELYGIKKVQTHHEISDGKDVYRVDHADSTYQKRTDVRWTSLASMMGPKEASESMLKSIGGWYHSDSVLLGKQCQVWTFENRALVEMWVHQGLVMKRIGKLGENLIITTATSIDFNRPVDERSFLLPAYQVKD